MRIYNQFLVSFITALILLSSPAFAETASPEPDSDSIATMPDIIKPRGSLSLSAYLSEDSEEIPNGLLWRIFAPEPDETGKLPLIASSEGGSSTIALAAGSYLVHVSYGRAGATKRIKVENEPKAESFILNAGGLKLDASITGGIRIPRNLLRFSIYDGAADNNGERPLIIPDVEPNTVVRLSAGTYHVVSTYGGLNAIVRTDIRVEPNELTEATVEHRASQLTLKLVREAGGEAIADTAWSVITDSGDSVRETVSAFASMVLAEGQYTIVAKNRDRLFQKDITVVPGRSQIVELLPSNQINPNDESLDMFD